MRSSTVLIVYWNFLGITFLCNNRMSGTRAYATFGVSVLNRSNERLSRPKEKSLLTRKIALIQICDDTF